jgi:hypothetical protein
MREDVFGCVRYNITEEVSHENNCPYRFNRLVREEFR